MCFYKSKGWLTAWGVSIGFVTLVCYLTAWVLYGLTLTGPAVPIAVALVLTAAAWPAGRKLWKNVLPSQPVWLQAAAHTVAATGVFLSLFLALNYWGGETATWEERASVTDKYRKKQYRTKRVGRRYTKQGEPYYTYYIRVRFADGTEKDFSQTQSQYAHAPHRGDSVTLTLSRGLLGMSVIHRDGKW